MLKGAARTLKIIILAAVVALFVAFAIDNRDFITVSLFPLPYAADLPKFLLIIVCFALGIVAGGLTVSLRYLKARQIFKAEHRRVQALQEELRHAHTHEQLPVVPPKQAANAQ